MEGCNKLLKKNFCRKKNVLTQEEKKPTYTWTEEWEKFPVRIKKYLLKPILWISFCIILIVFQLILHVTINPNIVKDIVFWKIYGLEIWRNITKLAIILVILLNGRKMYEIFLLRKKVVDEYLEIENRNMKNIPKNSFSCKTKILMLGTAFLLTIPRIKIFSKIVQFYSGYEKGVKIAFEILSETYQIIFIWMLFICLYFLIQFSNYFKSLSDRIKWDEVWLQPTKSDPSGGFKPLSNFIFNLCIKISIICIILIINNLAILLVEHDAYNMITILRNLYENKDISLVFYIFLNYALYILIPIIFFLVLFIRAEWSIHIELENYKNKLLRIYSKNKTEIMKEYRDISFENNTPINIAQENNTYVDLKKLEMSDYILNEINNLSVWTVNFKEYWKAISAIVPGIVATIQFILDHFL